jgi:hypothetical protein
MARLAAARGAAATSSIGRTSEQTKTEVRMVVKGVYGPTFRVLSMNRMLSNALISAASHHGMQSTILATLSRP